MIKYRRLSVEELEELEKEFIHFLAVNGIDADKWQDLKQNQNEEAEQFIESFSDLVVEKSLQSIEYIEHRTSSDYKIFFYDETEAQMIGVKSNSVNLLDNDWHASPKDHLTSGEISIIKGSKIYSKSRPEELFDMIQKGCLTAEQKTFTLLKKLAE